MNKKGQVIPIFIPIGYLPPYIKIIYGVFLLFVLVVIGGIFKDYLNLSKRFGGIEFYDYGIIILYFFVLCFVIFFLMISIYELFDKEGK